MFKHVCKLVKHGSLVLSTGAAKIAQEPATISTQLAVEPARLQIQRESANMHNMHQITASTISKGDQNGEKR